MGDSSKLNPLPIDILRGVLVGIGGGGAGLVFRARGVVRGDESFIARENRIINAFFEIYNSVYVYNARTHARTHTHTPQ